MKLKKEEKRKKILEAAIRIFARNGYFNSRVSEIAKEAGVADGTIYIYFQSKEEVLAAIFEEALQQFIAISKETLKEVHEPARKLETIARLQLQYLGSNRDLAMVFQIEFRHNIMFMERFSKTRLRDYFAIIQEAILDGQESGLFRNINSKFATKLFFGMIDELVTSWLISGKDYPLEDAAEPMTRVFVNGIAES